jgi:hypothetical protein
VKTAVPRYEHSVPVPPIEAWANVNTAVIRIRIRVRGIGIWIADRHSNAYAYRNTGL